MLTPRKHPYRGRFSGSTHEVLRNIGKVHKCGPIESIEGKRITHKVTKSQPYGGWDEIVMVHGRNGTATFNGLCWGYGGEGPRGLVELLVECGLNRKVADKIAFNAPRRERDGQCWEYQCHGGTLTYRPERVEPDGAVDAEPVISWPSEDLIHDLMSGAVTVGEHKYGLLEIPAFVIRTEENKLDTSVLKWSDANFPAPPAMGTHLDVCMNGIGTGVVVGRSKSVV